MKYILFQKALTGVCVLMVCSLISMGQDREPNAGVSLGKQYRDNAVPGVQYAPAKAAKSARRKAVATLPENHDESSGMQLKKGTLPGMQYAGGGAANTTFRKSSAAKVAKPAGGQPLSSEQPSSAGKQAAAKAAVAPVPLQEGQEPQEKAVVAPKTKTTPAQAKQAPVGRQ